MGVRIQQGLGVSTTAGGNRFKKVSSQAASRNSTTARFNQDSPAKMADLSRDPYPRTNLFEGQDEKLGPVIIAKVLLLRNNGYRRLKPSMEKIEKMRRDEGTTRRYLPVHILSTGLQSAPSARLAADADHEASRIHLIPISSTISGNGGEFNPVSLLEPESVVPGS